MGCLKANISVVSANFDASVCNGGGISFVVEVVRKRICGAMMALFRCVNDLFTIVRAVNDDSDFTISFAWARPKVDIGVVCMVNLDTECYLQVLDGDVITLDGCFIKVERG